MELTLTKEKDNAFLRRKEIEGTITFVGATPSKATLTEAFSKKTGSAKELIVTKGIHTTYGSQTANVSAYTYTDEKSRKQGEPLTHVHRKKVAEEKKKAAEAAKGA